MPITTSEMNGSKAKRPAISERTRQAENKKNVGEILWALEPFETNAEIMRPLASLLELWSRSGGNRISPVSVVGPMDINWAVNIPRKLRGVFERAALDSAAPMLDKFSVKNALDARIIIQASSSQSASIATLIELASIENADLIAVNTHGRKGLDRLFFGSFAEGLIVSSTVPVLTVNPKTEIPSAVSTILVPTDFTEESRSVFKKVLNWAVQFSARVVLLNRFSVPLPPFAYTEYGGMLDAQLVGQIFDHAEKARKQQARRGKAMAEKLGVKCQIIIDRDGDDLEHLILKNARHESADLIAMVSYRSSFGRALLGSTARGVLLGAACPVIVVHAARKHYSKTRLN
jgi:nucleotide-binding universal stress UspA family protein